MHPSADLSSIESKLADEADLLEFYRKVADLVHHEQTPEEQFNATFTAAKLKYREILR